MSVSVRCTVHACTHDHFLLLLLLWCVVFSIFSPKFDGLRQPNTVNDLLCKLIKTIDWFPTIFLTFCFVTLEHIHFFFFGGFSRAFRFLCTISLGVCLLCFCCYCWSFVVESEKGQLQKKLVTCHWNDVWRALAPSWWTKKNNQQTNEGTNE